MSATRRQEQRHTCIDGEVGKLKQVLLYIVPCVTMFLKKTLNDPVNTRHNATKPDIITLFVCVVRSHCDVQYNLCYLRNRQTLLSLYLEHLHIQKYSIYVSSHEVACAIRQTWPSIYIY